MLHPQVRAAAGIRPRPPAELLAAEPYQRLLFARAAMEE